MESYLPYILTKQQADELQSYLDSVPSRLHHTGDQKAGSAAAFFPAFAFQALPKKLQDSADIDAIVSAFQADLDSRLPVRIITPRFLSSAVLETLREWVSEHMTQPATLEVAADQKIGAGLIIELNGRRYDYTLKYSI